ncbi:N-formylglutamate amidohydrolase [Candidatus Gracilibacteria bacterium]|nr:N-formylglutamate amidohydrolase [Candidatus Gracilibacteria bacterium]
MEKFPILVSIPHSSLFVPKEILSNLIATQFDLRNMTDLYTDEIFSVTNAFTVFGEINRLILNLNRAPEGIKEDCQYSVSTTIGPDGKRIFKTMPTIEEVQELITRYHRPFHRKIENLIKEKNIKFFLDGHSMWSTRPPNMYGNGDPRPDICLGNLEYTTCGKTDTDFVRKFFESKGYTVKVNDPYTGKYNIAYHCSHDGLRGLQIEINRAIFMNEKTLEAYPEQIDKLHEEMTELVEKLAKRFE